MRWTVHGERYLHESDWMSLALVDVEIPGGRRFEHHVLRFPRPAAGTVLFDPRSRCVLLLWRHRFITDQWGWEIPAGGLDEGESPEEGAVREAVEESGWRPLSTKHLAGYNPMPGGVDQVFHLYFSNGAEHVGEPTDPSESERIEWVPLDDVRAALTDGRIVEGMSLTALALAFATGAFDT
ncbi:MAG TPA: NUDIX hydrolase [Acidimicrobiales bacterium]